MLTLSLLLLLCGSASAMLLGWVESPGYPNGYPPHASLNWSRCASKGHTLSIQLLHLDMEDSQDCENDALKVFSNGNLISVLCGKRGFKELQSTVDPSLLSTPGGCLSLTFHSDFSNTKRHTGFKGFYTLQDFDECVNDEDSGCTQFCHNYIGGYHCSCRHGYHLDVDKRTCTVACAEDLSGLKEGEISSPSWPASYVENAHCQYSLSVEPTLQLELLFSQVFDVEQSPDGQCIDALRIETHSESLGSFCGNTPPPSPFLTHSHRVQIHFTSDGYGTNKGFSLAFRTRDKVCPAVVTSDSTVTPHQAEYLRGETVTATCDLGYFANTQGTQALITQYETTCQDIGEWNPNYKCEPVDCGYPEIPEDGVLQLVESDNMQTKYKDQIQFHCSSKYYTLEGDDTYTCGASGDWASGSGEAETPKCIEVCGKLDRHIESAGRIVGGEDATLGEIPWQLLITGLRRGAATLISDRWAVTAAHVVGGGEVEGTRVYGGLVDGGTGVILPKGVLLDIESIIIHPNYKPLNYDHDIALIRFSSRVNLGPNLLPVCLPQSNRGLVDDEVGTVSGWGGTETASFSKRLKYAHINVYSSTVCQSTLEKPTTFTRNMFCAGSATADSCKRDSGGPLVMPMVFEGNEPYYLTGIVSWGAKCRLKQFKGYYVKVENYVAWIKETMNSVGQS
ncbi:hypothetical protein CesoFtcFv8_012251 [Champsocephalus esox]|uniref:Uncharacterized protein n=1 Tax=Champsocephalus esox TaxID=159716 RepID=A0AAN8GTT8_9TELE|nr:hypothetical protein CesoFtcFv8_012251 [Champsocephalus esox]